MSWSDHDILEVMFRFRTLGQTGKQIALIMEASRSAILGHVHRLSMATDQVEALAFRDHERFLILDRVLSGKTAAEEVAKDFAKARGRPVHRVAILYLVWVILNDLAAAGEGAVANPDNADAVAWPSWWRCATGKAVAA